MSIFFLFLGIDQLPAGNLYKQWAKDDFAARDDHAESPEMMKRIADGMRVKAQAKGVTLSDEHVESRLKLIVEQKRNARSKAGFAAQQRWPDVVADPSYQTWSRANEIYTTKIKVFCDEYRVCFV
jgi:hypothetical protein